jgi:2-keto-4-pentenoate hydratase/2-oxohepta-3-ene-1,7-dioic acid hydratase in catechol pathway
MRIARVLDARAELTVELVGDDAYPLAGDPFTDPRRAGDPRPAACLPLLSPTVPRQILITMSGFLPPDGTPLPPGSVPWLVPKLAAQVSGDGGEIVIPAEVTRLWIEVELAIVIGKPVRNATPDEAAEAIFGYTCFHDATAPDFLFDDIAARKLRSPFDTFRAKSIETFASMGPWIETSLTPDDIRDGLRLSARVNGEERATGTTRSLKFPVTDWVTFASTYMTLYPGDVISLGTPQPCEAVAGDLIELEIEGIGTLHNRVVSANRHPRDG